MQRCDYLYGPSRSASQHSLGLDEAWFLFISFTAFSDFSFRALRLFSAGRDKQHFSFLLVHHCIPLQQHSAASRAEQGTMFLSVYLCHNSWPRPTRFSAPYHCMLHRLWRRAEQKNRTSTGFLGNNSDNSHHEKTAFLGGQQATITSPTLQLQPAAINSSIQSAQNKTITKKNAQLSATSFGSSSSTSLHGFIG